MRDRLVASFVAVALVVTVVAGIARGVAVRERVEVEQATRLDQAAALLLGRIQERRDAGGPVTRDFLESIVPPTSELSYTPPGASAAAVVTGGRYAGGSGELLHDRLAGDAGEVVLSEPAPDLSEILADDQSALVTLLALVLLAAGMAGGLVARLLAAPFQRLAVDAEALGRGRLDVTPRRSRFREARAIGDALEISARRLEKRFAVLHPFVEDASHRLRTPLTGMRIELEDLLGRNDLDDDVLATLSRCLGAVDRVDTHLEKVLAEARAGAVLEDAEVPLPTVARDVAQRWSDRLGRRRFRGVVDGDLDVTVVPGPVEQLLDLLLEHVRARTTGPVTMAFQADGSCLWIRLESSWRTDSSPRSASGSSTEDPLAEAQHLATLLGGRIREPGAVSKDLEILLPVG